MQQYGIIARLVLQQKLIDTVIIKTSRISPLAMKKNKIKFSTEKKN